VIEEVEAEVRNQLSKVDFEFNVKQKLKESEIYSVQKDI
jgi:hypothetical protein